MAASVTQNTRTPHEIDEDLAAFIYGNRGDELSGFFLRRSGSPANAAALLGETFALAAQLRLKRKDRAANDAEWVDSIAHLQLSQFLRAGRPSTKAIVALGMSLPEFAHVEITEPLLAAAA